MKKKDENIWKKLEKGFGGGSKFRVLLHFILNPNKIHTKYALVKSTGLRAPSVNSQLNVLIQLGWIVEYAFTPKTYRINLDDDIVKEAYSFIYKIKSIRKSF
jgi:hypothetical protein